MTEADFSDRLSKMVNTFWLTAQWTVDITDHIDANISALELSSTYQQSTAIIIESRSVYKAKYVGITVLLVVSAILLICAFASLSLLIFTVAPDILGFVSSLTRDNPWFESCPESTLLDGEQRARNTRFKGSNCGRAAKS